MFPTPKRSTPGPRGGTTLDKASPARPGGSPLTSAESARKSQTRASPPIAGPSKSAYPAFPAIIPSCLFVPSTNHAPLFSRLSRGAARIRAFSFNQHTRANALEVASYGAGDSFHLEYPMRSEAKHLTCRLSRLESRMLTSQIPIFAPPSIRLREAAPSQAFPA